MIDWMYAKVHVHYNLKLHIYTRTCMCRACSLTDWLCTGRELSGEERDELVAAACYMHITREDTAKQFINQERYCAIGNRLYTYIVYLYLHVQYEQYERNALEKRYTYTCTCM